MSGWGHRRLGGWVGKSHTWVGGCLLRRVGRINAFVSVAMNGRGV